MKTSRRIIFVFLAIVVGIYPLAYLVFDMSYGLLGTKEPALLESSVWNFAFYQHILFGAVAMLAGWIQFSSRFRNKYLTVHRAIGKIYLVAVLLSGAAGLYIARYATGGMVAVIGFSGLAVAWLFTTFQAYAAIRRMEIDHHQDWMVRSYALCFAAVTLRIWLPLFQFGFDMEFIPAYRIIAWLCWVPNLAVGELIVRNLRRQRISGRKVRERQPVLR